MTFFEGDVCIIIHHLDWIFSHVFIFWHNKAVDSFSKRALQGFLAISFVFFFQ